MNAGAYLFGLFHVGLLPFDRITKRMSDDPVALLKHGLTYSRRPEVIKWMQPHQDGKQPTIPLLTPSAGSGFTAYESLGGVSVSWEALECGIAQYQIVESGDPLSL